MAAARGWVRILVLVALLIASGAVAGAAQAPDDPGFEDQWALDVVGAPAAWERARGTGITIAVVDTGVQLDHDDLAGKIVGHVSCIGANDDPARCSGPGRDDHGHGTHVAGIAAAETFNRSGVAAVAPEARILAVRVLEADDMGGARGTAGDVRAGIRWAVDHGADVINLSLGELVVVRNLFGSGIAPAVRDAWDEGAIPVVAAGNTDLLLGSGYGDVPALIVTATNRNDRKASYATSVADARWGMAAPGGETGSEPDIGILSTWRHPQETNHYAVAAGTSMAAPHVSGAAAVLRSLGLSPRQTVDRLLGTAAAVGGSATGAGRLDLAAATGASTTSGTAPTPTSGPAASAEATSAPATTRSPTSPTSGTERGDDPTEPQAPQAPQAAGSAEPATTSAPSPPTAPATSAPETVDDSAVAFDADEDGGGGGFPWPITVVLALASLPLLYFWRRHVTPRR